MANHKLNRRGEAGAGALPGRAPRLTLPAMLKAIVFDFDGVLVDSEPLHYQAFAQVGETIGVRFDYEHYLEHLIGFDDRDAFALLLEEAPPDAVAEPRREQIARLCAQKQTAFERLVEAGITPMPGAVELLDEAAAQMPVAIASGATRADLQLILGQLNRWDAVHAIVSADDVQRSKPDPESYAKAVRQLAERFPDLALQPGECLAIEDTAAGIASAEGAGLITLGLTTTGPPDKLQAARRIITSLDGIALADLRRWFNL